MTSVEDDSQRINDADEATYARIENRAASEDGNDNYVEISVLKASDREYGQVPDYQGGEQHYEDVDAIIQQ